MRYYRQIVLWFFVLLFLPSTGFGQDIQLNRREIVRNGDFYSGSYKSWFASGCGIWIWNGKDGTRGMSMVDHNSDQDHYALQVLPIPSVLNAATLRFDYSVDDANWTYDFPEEFKIAFAESRGFDGDDLYDKPLPVDIIDEAISITIDALSDWQTVERDLDQALISKIQAAHNDGKYVFLVLMQQRTNPETLHSYETLIDNISLKVDGIQHAPDMQGQIAYLEELEEDGYVHSVNLLDPNTGQSTTIWDNPDGIFEGYSYLAWSPDASRLAFTSRHDAQFGIFDSDIYSIRPDGSGQRRIPDTPTQQELESDDYPHAMLSGTLYIDGGSPGELFTIYLLVQGTNSGIMLQGSAYDNVPFIIPDVPVLNDPAVFNQALILRWYSNECDGGFEYTFPSALVAGESADLGRVNFYAANCTGFFSGYAPRDLSWKYDGTEIGFRLLGLYTVDVNATKELILSTLDPDGLSSSNLAWSPVDDRYLYIEFNYSNTKYDLYLAKEGGTATLLLEAIEDITPAWLPDGSGFIYVAPGIPFRALDKNIFQYDLDSGQKTRLTWFGSESVENVSMSPDGRYIVFQQETELGINGPYDSDLWILDRLNPTEMWKLTDSGNYQSPVWSPKDPVVLDDDPADDGGDDPADDGGDDTGGGGGDSGGGCFIATMNP